MTGLLWALAAQGLGLPTNIGGPQCSTGISLSMPALLIISLEKMATTRSLPSPVAALRLAALKD